MRLLSSPPATPRHWAQFTTLKFPMQENLYLAGGREGVISSSVAKVPDDLILASDHTTPVANPFRPKNHLSLVRHTINAGIVRTTVQLSVIMLSMLRRGSKFRQAMSLVLPFVLLWSFVGCLALCSDHAVTEPHESAQITNEAESHSDEGCPIPATSVLIPSRQTDGMIPQVSATVHPPCHLSRVVAQPNRLPALLAFTTQSSTADPPLERLGSLRI